MTAAEESKETGPGTESLALSVVVPCFNEEESLRELHSRATKACRSVVADDFELLLINDGSTDRTRLIIEELCDQDPSVVGLLLAKNHGHQLALTAGLGHCRGDRVLILDADLQDPPELLSDMMALMDEGADVVFGQRAKRAGESAFKKITAAGFYWLLSKLVDTEIPRDAGDFRLISRRIVDVINQMPEQDRFIRGMVSWSGFRQVPLLYERQERFGGETKYPLRKMIRFAVDAISSFSTFPLKVVAYFGFAFSGFALLMLIWTIAGYMAGSTVPGWASTMVIVLLIGGVQLISLGIMGQYIGRIYMQSKNRPLYVVESIIGDTYRRSHAETDVNIRL